MTEEVIIPDPPATPDTRELAVMRKQTKHFIRTAQTVITILRGGEKVPDGAGGYTTEPGEPIDPQEFRLILQGGNVASKNIDGEEIQPSYVLLGLWDADIEPEDTFVLDGRNYEVDFVRRPNGYETWAEVTYHG